MSENPASDDLNCRLNTAESCVLPLMLERQAQRIGDKTMVVFDQGPAWTYSEAARIIRGTAAALEEYGVHRGMRVLVWLPDGPTIFRVMLGLQYLGAVSIPLNPDIIGSVLEQSVNDSEASLMIAESRLLSLLSDLNLDCLCQIISVDNDPSNIHTLGDKFNVSGQDVLEPLDRDPTPLDPPLKPWDTHSIFFSSGTTGTPKGVVCSHIHTCTMAVDGLRFLNSEDRFMSPSAFFHIAGAYVPWAIINAGATMVIVGRYSTSNFWEQVRRNAVTGTVLIGVMVDFLLNAPERHDDSDNTLRFVVQYPLAHDVDAFKARFNVEVYTQYDQTEMGPPIASDFLETGVQPGHGYCGKLRPGFQARIVDENDCEVSEGEAGELTVRCDVPWVIATEYFKRPDETARAWRNGWYHTGDRFRQNETGEFYFVDRTKDVIRRRGENISSHVLEREAVRHPCVNAAAAYGVKAEFSESEVMIAIEPVDGASITPQEVSGFMRKLLPAYMVPRYIRVVTTLPRSTTDKVAKSVLQMEGVTDDTWDSECNAKQDRQVTLPV